MGKQYFKGNRFDAFMVAPEDVVVIGLDTNDGPEHFLYDERINLPLDPAMVQNVKALTVRKAINCTRLVINDEERPCVVDGRQRVRCAREANKQLVNEGEPPMKIKIIPERGEEAQLMAIGTSTNCFHVEDTIVEKARKAQRLRDRGLTTSEVATSLGVTTTTLAMWSKILGLATPVLKAVSNGQVSASAASRLDGLSKDDQAEQLKELISASNGKRVTGRTVVSASAKSGRKGATDKPLAPGKRLAHRVIAASDEGNLEMSQDFIEGVRWALGDLAADEISVVVGISDYIEAINK